MIRVAGRVPLKPLGDDNAFVDTGILAKIDLVWNMAGLESCEYEIVVP